MWARVAAARASDNGTLILLRNGLTGLRLPRRSQGKVRRLERDRSASLHQDGGRRVDVRDRQDLIEIEIIPVVTSAGAAAAGARLTTLTPLP